jgi:hypothetical protein
VVSMVPPSSLVRLLTFSMTSSSVWFTVGCV